MGMFAPAVRAALTEDDFFRDDFGRSTVSGQRVSATSSTRVTVVLRCVKLLTDAISTLSKDVVISIGGQRFTEFQRPQWLTSPTPADPSITDVEHFSQVVGAMALEGDSFTFVPDGIHPLDGIVGRGYLEVLDPRHVNVRRGPLYDILDQYGRVVETVGPDRMLHISWYRPAGRLRGLSPIEEARQAVGLALGTEEFAARFFGQGATMALGVEVPGALTSAQRDDLREGLEGLYSGTRNAHRIGVVTGGAKLVTGLGVNNDQAQFLESRKFSVEDIARLFGVPPHLVGSQEPGASSYSSVEERSLEFAKFNIAPWVSRITAQYSRLVSVPERLEGTGATARFAMDLRSLERADIKTRYEAYSLAVGGPWLEPNVPRALEDLPPIAGGDSIHVQSQMVPLGTTQEDAA